MIVQVQRRERRKRRKIKRSKRKAIRRMMIAQLK
jgi:hypothetical protein